MTGKFPRITESESKDQGCHADVFGWTDGRKMAVGASMTWTHCSVLLKLPGVKPCVHADIGPSARTSSPPSPFPNGREEKKKKKNLFFFFLILIFL
jgi:hypothetical protein